jgi:hypothetical protein
MKASGQREIVIEIEKVQLIRKRAKTQLRFCPDCKTRSDFMSLCEAAQLFDTPSEDIISFVNANRCHFQADISGDVYLCLTVVLEAMRTKVGNSRVKLIGDISK